MSDRREIYETRNISSGAFSILPPKRMRFAMERSALRKGSAFLKIASICGSPLDEVKTDFQYGSASKPTELELAWIEKLTTIKSMTYPVHAQNGLECNEKHHVDDHLDLS